MSVDQENQNAEHLVPMELTVANLDKRVSIYASVTFEDLKGEHDKQYTGFLEAFFIHKNGILIQLRGFDIPIAVKYDHGDRIEVNIYE